MYQHLIKDCKISHRFLKQYIDLLSLRLKVINKNGKITDGTANEGQFVILRSFHGVKRLAESSNGVRRLANGSHYQPVTGVIYIRNILIFGINCVICVIIAEYLCQYDKKYSWYISCPKFVIMNTFCFVAV